jgi:hypothetical protein
MQIICYDMDENKIIACLCKFHSRPRLWVHIDMYFWYDLAVYIMHRNAQSVIVGAWVSLSNIQGKTQFSMHALKSYTCIGGL